MAFLIEVTVARVEDWVVVTALFLFPKGRFNLIKLEHILFMTNMWFFFIFKDFYNLGLDK